MSNSINTTSQNVTDPTVADPRIAEISGFTGLAPADVLGHVQDDAARNGHTVEEELNDDVAVVELIAALGDE